MNKTLTSNSEEQTLSLASSIGSRLRGQEVVELISDLGGGKTTFTKGLVMGAGSKDKVHSPSFTIENEYRAKHLIIHHLDFYRLNDPGIMKDELSETLENPTSVIVLEWAGLVTNILPEDRLIIRIEAKSENVRQFKINCPDTLNYLIEDIQ